MRIRFLLDEHLPHALVDSVKQYNKEIDILRIGLGDAPPLGTPDPEILLYCEATQRVLVTDNRASMPGHETDHFAAGRHHWGIFEINRGLSIGQMAYQLSMFWGASEAEEWIDNFVYLPY